MAKVHEIGVGADTRAFEDGIKRGVVKPTEDAEKALKKLGDTDAGSDAARDIDKLEDALKDAQRESKKLGDAGDRAGDDITKGMRRAEEGVEDFKQEAQQSIKETAASFSDITDATDLLQEVAANAFAGFGPAGMVAGAAAAIGIGAAASGFEAVGEAEQESRERAAEWAQAYVEAGSRILNSALTVAKQQDIATDPERYKTATDNAKAWGVDVSTAIAAMAGETWALNAAQDSLATMSQKVADGMETVGQRGGMTSDEMDKLMASTAEAHKSFDALQGEMQLGAEQADALSESLRRTAQNTEGAISTVDEFGDTVTTLPDGTTIYIDADTKQATTDLDLIEKKVYATPSNKEITVAVRTNLEQAQRDVDGFFVRNNGKTITYKGKVITSGYDQ